MQLPEGVTDVGKRFFAPNSESIVLTAFFLFVAVIFGLALLVHRRLLYHARREAQAVPSPLNSFQVQFAKINLVFYFVLLALLAAFLVVGCQDWEWRKG